MSRDRIDEVRRLLVDAFMAEDTAVYSQAVVELERLIGVDHGDRNPKNTTMYRSAEALKSHAAMMRQFKFGNKTIDAERHEDGMLTYSIKYEDKP